MKRIVALLLITLLLLGGCGAPAEDTFTPNDSPLITVDPETESSETPETETPSTEQEQTPSEETPSPEQEQAPSEETPTEDEPVEETPKEETPDEETPSDDEDEESAEWTTSCMTFNVLEKNSGGTQYQPPDVRAPWILETIKKYNPDLLGCQEVTKGTGNSENYNMYAFLTSNLAKEGYEFSGLMDSKGKAGSKVAIDEYHIGSGLLIFWKKDRFQLKDSGAMVYSNDSNRHYQWVKLYDTKEDITILMTNTHMSIPPKVGDSYDIPKGHALRATQGQEIYNFWDKTCGDDLALYATGDYNHDTNQQAFHNETQGRFVSSRDVSQSSNANSSIDHVFINGDIQDCFNYTRCNDTFEPKGVTAKDPNNRNIAYCASDHYAVIVYCSNAYR